MSSSMFVSLSVVTIALLLLIGWDPLLSSAATIPGCQAFGYDFSPLAVDLTTAATGINGQSTAGYVLHLCGAIQSSPCGVITSNTYGAMVCQEWPNYLTYNQLVTVATWNPNNTYWTYTSRLYQQTLEKYSSHDGQNSQGGVSLTMYDGATCGNFNAPRIVYINFQCATGPGASTVPSTFSIYESPYGCIYTITINTTIVCPASNVAQPFCKAFGLDFSPLNNFELTGTPSVGSSDVYTFRMCGTVTQNTYCATGSTSMNSMICQQYGLPSTPSNAISTATYNPSVWAWNLVNGVDTSAGVEFIAENGNNLYCSGGLPRTSLVTFVCGPYSPTNPPLTDSFEVIEGSCYYQLVVPTTIVCTPSQLAAISKPNTPTAVNKAFTGMGYDFSSLTTLDMTAQASDSQYVIHLGGVVSNGWCATSTIQNTYSAMICQLWQVTTVNPIPAITEAVAIWNQTTARWAYTNNQNYSGGVSLSMWDGTTNSCGSFGPRYAVINFVCNAQVTGYPSNSQISVTEIAIGCSYVFTIPTSIVCSPPTNPPSTPGCSWGGIDFSPLIGTQLYGVSNGGNIYNLNLCGVQAACNPSNANVGPNVMMCQQYSNTDPTQQISVSSYNPAQMPWNYINGNDQSGGIQVIAETGNPTYCGGFQRTVFLQFQCGPTVVPGENYPGVGNNNWPTSGGWASLQPHGNSIGVVDGSCQYNAIILTSLVCTAAQSALWAQYPRTSQTALNTGFTGMGYDFSSLTQYDIRGTTSNGQYVMHLGNSVQDPWCRTSWADRAQQAMVCQKWQWQPTFFYAYPIEAVATWSPNLATWSYINSVDNSRGVQLSMWSGSVNDCPTSFGRLVQIQFVCNSTQTSQTRTMLVIEDQVSCAYTIIVQTSIVCTASGFTQPFCQGAGYDFSSLSTYDMYGNNGDGDLYTMRMCGVVSNQYCNAVTSSINSMICQFAFSSIKHKERESQQYSMPFTPQNAVSVATYLPFSMTWGFINDNDYTGGVSLAVFSGNGEYCGNPRVAFITFVCNPAATQPTSFTVVDTNTGISCGYMFQVQTSIVCSPPTISQTVGPGQFSSQASSSSSSSLSNGAVAGIVIGVVFGVLILCCLACILWALAAGGIGAMGSKQTKTTDTSSSPPVTSKSTDFNKFSNEPSATKDVELSTTGTNQGEAHDETTAV